MRVSGRGCDTKGRVYARACVQCATKRIQGHAMPVLGRKTVSWMSRYVCFSTFIFSKRQQAASRVPPAACLIGIETCAHYPSCGLEPIGSLFGKLDKLPYTQ